MNPATDKRPPRKVSPPQTVEQPETARTAPQEGDSERFHEYVERRLAGYDRRQSERRGTYVSRLPTHQELVRRGARYCSSCGTDEAMPGHEC